MTSQFADNNFLLWLLANQHNKLNSNMSEQERGQGNKFIDNVIDNK